MRACSRRGTLGKRLIAPQERKSTSCKLNVAFLQDLKAWARGNGG